MNNKCLLTILLCLLCIRGNAYDAIVDNICYNFNGEEAEVTYYSSNSTQNSNFYKGDIVIPSSVVNEDKTYKVTKVGINAFYYCTNLTSITISEGVTTIGNGAFYGCSNLGTIIVPNSTLHIESAAFNYSKWLNDQPNGLLYIGKVCLGYKGNMPEDATLELMDGTLGVACSAFSGSKQLKAIQIPNSVIEIGEYNQEIKGKMNVEIIPVSA